MISAPGDITIGPPSIPTVSVAPPSSDITIGSSATLDVLVAPPSTTLVVVPVQGPAGGPGPSGPAGPAGPAGDSGAALGFVQNVTALSTILINTGLSFKAAGITCIDTSGDTVYGATVTYPAAGFIQIEFGVQFSGVVYLS